MGHSVNWFNGLAIVLTLVLLFVFLAMLWHSISYLRDVVARIVYIVRIASKRNF